MRILIVGAGSIGTVLGVKFSKTQEVVLLRKKHLGVRSIEIFGEESFSATMLISSIQNLTGSFDIIFVTTQAQQTRELCKQLKNSAIKFESASFVSMQNGVRNSEILKLYFAQNLILAASIWWSATLISPLKVYYHRKSETRIGISHLPQIQAGKKTVNMIVNTIVNMIALEFDCRYVQNIEVELFKKLAINTISPVLALVKKPYPEGLFHPPVKALALCLFEEAVCIILSSGVDITDPMLSNYYKLLKQDGSFNEASHHNLHKVSTQISVEKYGGKLSNVGELLGKLRQMGIENECPINYIDEVLNVTYRLPANYKAFSVKEITKLLNKVNVPTKPVNI